MFTRTTGFPTGCVRSGQASPRDDVVFEAGLFGGALGIRRTFILHAHGSKLPSDLLGLTSVRYGSEHPPCEADAINQKLRKAIETEGRRRTSRGVSVGNSRLAVRSREEDRRSRHPTNLAGTATVASASPVSGLAGGRHPSARYWSEATKERRGIIRPACSISGRGERPRHPNAPQLEGTGEITVETADRATGYWTTRSDRDPGLNARTAGVSLRADASDLQVLESGRRRGAVRSDRPRLREWKSAANAFLTAADPGLDVCASPRRGIGTPAHAGQNLPRDARRGITMKPMVVLVHGAFAGSSSPTAARSSRKSRRHQQDGRDSST